MPADASAKLPDSDNGTDWSDVTGESLKLIKKMI